MLMTGSDSDETVHIQIMTSRFWLYRQKSNATDRNCRFSSLLNVNTRSDSTDRPLVSAFYSNVGYLKKKVSYLKFTFRMTELTDSQLRDSIWRELAGCLKNADGTRPAFDLQIHSLTYLSLLASRSIAVITTDQKRAQDFFTQTNLQHKKKKDVCALGI